MRLKDIRYGLNNALIGLKGNRVKNRIEITEIEKDIVDLEALLKLTIKLEDKRKVKKETKV